ncbi:surface protease GP63 [Trypanosoma grayi]|uniref:surface protease GP63 n=1 Tax=Trypanosoma grayi TaxID=71804 RepID=UPI0004F3F418|nr:surface protease GP63 [Trypanosoma grayi]KEG09903.1 surface protease GP63 [Trypanosoma grayi]
MRRLLCLTVLLLCCAAGCLATTERHRCIFDYVPVLFGVGSADFVPNPTEAVEMQLMASAREDGRLDELEGDREVGDARKINVTELPSHGWSAIRINVSTKDLDMDSRRCTEANRTIRTFGDQEWKCTSEDVLTEEKKKILTEKILPAAVKLHSERLFVARRGLPLVVPNFDERSVCGQFAVPEEHKGKAGVPDTDMMLYVAAAPTLSSAFAWSAVCAVDADGRPLVGVLNFNPRHIATTPQAIRVAAHEMAHTLGFNLEGMKSANLKVERRTVRDKPTYFLTSNNTRAMAARHYSCESTIGMELEDEMTWTPSPAEGSLLMRSKVPRVSLSDFLEEDMADSSDSQEDIRVAAAGRAEAYDWNLPARLGYNSHWKRRNAKDELMAGHVGAGYYTAITMSVFVELGYYRANWSKAEPMRWGNRSGCALLEKKCVDNGHTDYPGMFCTEASATPKCTSDFQALGNCGIEESRADTPQVFQYFGESGKKGGLRDDLMEYCPVIVAGAGTGCMSGNASKMLGSVVGPSSRCVRGNDLKVGDQKVGDVCVEVACEYGSVYVRYAGAPTYYLCPQGRFLKTWGDFAAGGSIACPLYDDVCTTMLPREGKHRDPIPPPSLSEMDISATLVNMATGTYQEDSSTITTVGSTSDVAAPSSTEAVGTEGVAAEEDLNQSPLPVGLPGVATPQDKNIVVGGNADGSVASAVFASLLFVFAAASAVVAL